AVLLVLRPYSFLHCSRTHLHLHSFPTRRSSDLEYAVERLTGAAQTLDAGTRSRARALCAAQLAALHFAVNDHPAGTAWARQALATASRVPSARLRHFLATIQATAEAHHDNPEIEQGAPI